MLEDKIFLEKEITPSVVKLVDEVKKMIAQRATLPKMYDYIMTHSKNYNERYIVLILFGMAYQSYKEERNFFIPKM